MEPWLVGTIVSAYTTVFGGVVVALINRSSKKGNGKGGAYNGEERRASNGYCTQGRFDEGMKELRGDIAGLRNELGQHMQYHMK